MASELEKALEQARKDAEKARKDAASDTKGGSSKLSKELEKARADAAKAVGDAKKDGGLFGTVKKGLGGAFNVATSALGAPQQAVFNVGGAVVDLARGDVKGAAGRVGQALEEVGTLGQVGGDIGFSEAATTTKGLEAGRIIKLPKGLETAANIVLDPTLVTVASKAKQGKEAAAAVSRVLGEETAARGAKALTVAERSAVRQAVRESALETGATGGRRSLKEVATGVKAPAKLTAEEGAERVAGRVETGLDFLSRNVPATPVGSAIRSGTEAARSGARSVADTISTKGPGEWFQHAFIPRAGIALDPNMGKAVAAEVKAAGGERLANVARDATDTMAEVSAILNRLDPPPGAARGVKLTADEDALLASALKGSAEAVDAMRGGRLEELYNYLRFLEDKSQKTMKSLVASKPGAVAKAAPVVEDAASLGALVDRLKGFGMDVPASLAKRLEDAKAGIAPAPKGAAAAEDLGSRLGDIGTRGVQDTVNRYFTSVYEQETVKYMTRLKGLTGADNESIIKAISSSDAVPEGYARLKSGFWGGGAAPKPLVEEIDRLGQLLEGDKGLKGLNNLLDKYDRFWKSSATSLPVSLAFTARNIRSNLYLNWLDGIYTFAPYREAAALQRKASDILRGKKYADDIASMGVDATLRKHMTVRQYRVWRLAQDNRVVNSNYADIDLAFKGVANVPKIKGIEDTASLASKAGREFTTEGKAFRAGRTMNSAAEDNARLANFIHNLDRTGDAKQAASHVYKFLFDYSDLTKTEQQAIKKWVPFYTFMRKNVPLQVEQSIMQSGMVGARLRAGEAATEPLSEDAPSYLERGGARGLPEVAAGLLGRAGTQIALTPDTPLSAAAGTLDPFLKLAGSAPAIARREAPESMAEDVWRPLLGFLGGGRGSAIKLAAGEAAGESLFTGGELPPKDLIIRTLAAGAPGYQRLGSIHPEIKRIIGLPVSDAEKAESIQQWLLRQAGIKTRAIE